MKAVGAISRQELQPAAPRPAPADPRRRARGRHDGRARGRLALPAQHDDGRRRPHHHRAHDPASPTSTRTSPRSGRPTQGRLHADAGRRPTAASGARTTGTRRRTSGRTRASRSSCRRSSSTRAPAAARWRPRTSSTTSDIARVAAVAREGRRSRATRRPRPARGPRPPLGDLDARPGRHDAARGAALRHGQSAAKTLGMDRDIGSLEPGKLADLIVIDGNPLAGHPPVGEGRLDHGQRPPLRRGDAERDGVARAQAGEVLVGVKRPCEE